jgi:N-acetylmuramoyl-L-alanine amidase
MSEKDVVLSIAKGIQREGAANDIKVILTRNGDEPLTLDERVLVTNRYKADAFISLHTNFDENASTTGIACMVSEKSSRFTESKRLADNLVQELQTLQGISVNGIMKSNPHVLSKNSIPAILLELGYLSNPKDYKYITDQENQKHISKSIIAAVIRYTK